MSSIDRRQFLLAAATLPLAGYSAQHAQGAPAGATPQPRLALPPLPAHLPTAWAQAEVLKLWPASPPGAESFRKEALPRGAPEVFLENVDSPDLHVFRPRKSNGHAILAIPGGAYKFVSVVNEGVAVAERFCPHGFTVLVLTYRLPGEGWRARADVPLQDAQRAMRVIRRDSHRLGINADSIATLGFSAGGHLAATLAVDFSAPVYGLADEADSLSARPNSTALIYPVVTMDSRWTHAQSRTQLLGEAASDADVARRSPNLHVGPGTSPMFIVHAVDDPAVPVENSLLMLEAMRSARRPIEAHLLQEGGHAFGTGFPDTSSALWPDLFLAWHGRLRGA